MDSKLKTVKNKKVIHIFAPLRGFQQRQLILSIDCYLKTFKAPHFLVKLLLFDHFFSTHFVQEKNAKILTKSRKVTKAHISRQRNSKNFEETSKFRSVLF